MSRPLRDKRYSVTKEFTGAAKAQFVVRFCDEWVTSRSSYGAAVLSAASHKCQADGALVVEEIKPETCNDEARAQD
jgi:hypothetical protein